MRWSMPETTRAQARPTTRRTASAPPTASNPAQLCLACLTCAAAVRRLGPCRQAVPAGHQVSDASAHARAVATGSSDRSRLARPTRQARPLAGGGDYRWRIELAAMELTVRLGISHCRQRRGGAESAAGHCWALLERWKQTEERHFVISPLRWATTFFAESGDAAGLVPAPRPSLGSRLTLVRMRPMSALSHALGETALIDGSV